jgi:hypothetical protein
MLSPISQETATRERETQAALDGRRFAELADAEEAAKDW